MLSHTYCQDWLIVGHPVGVQRIRELVVGVEKTRNPEWVHMVGRAMAPHDALSQSSGALHCQRLEVCLSQRCWDREIVLACPSGLNVITRSFSVRGRQESQRGENQDIIKDAGSF